MARRRFKSSLTETIVFRIQPEIKEMYKEILKLRGQTMQQHLWEMTLRYVRAHRKELYSDSDA